MRAEGDWDYALPPDVVYARLTDARFLAGCLRDVQVVRADVDSAEWKMRPKLAFMAGSIDSTLTILERTSPSGMKASVTSKGIGATATVETNLTVAAHDGGTRVHWTMQITQLTGLLRVVPKGLIQAAALKVVEDVWSMIEAGLKK